MKHKLFLFVFLLTTLSVINGQAFERKKYNFNSEWKLRIGDFPKAKDAKFDDSKWKQVTLPHAFNEDEAFKLSIEQLTDTVVWYRKTLSGFRNWKSNQKVFVEFEGVRQARRLLSQRTISGQTRKWCYGGRVRPDSIYQRG